MKIEKTNESMEGQGKDDGVGQLSKDDDLNSPKFFTYCFLYTYNINKYIIQQGQFLKCSSCLSCKISEKFYREFLLLGCVLGGF